MGSAFVGALAAVAIGLPAACARSGRPVPSPIPAPAEAAPEGRSSYQFLLDRDAYRPALSEGEELIKPHAIGPLLLPDYPPAPLAARWGNATVAVRIWVGETGVIDSVEDSPLARSTPGPYASDFRTAVDAAVRRWRLTAGEIVTYKPCPSFPDYQPPPNCKQRDTSRNVRVFYDVRIEFALVEGKGEVAVGGAPGP